MSDQMRRPAVLLAALAMLVALATPAPAANGLRTSGNRVLVTIPIRVGGAAEEAETIGKLNGQGQRLAEQPIFGCFEVVPSVVAEPGPDAHELVVLPQRTGQFVRPSATGSSDPFTGPRQLVVGSLQLDMSDALRGPLPLLLSELPRTGDEDFLASALERVTEGDNLTALKPCAWQGTLALRAEFERYHLVVTADVGFTFSVDPKGRITGKAEPMTRSATAEDPDLGHCTTDSAPGFPIRVRGRAEADGFSLEFTPKGPEVDITLSCDGGNLEIGGDYLKAAFQPQGRLVLPIAARNGAIRTEKGRLQGRDTQARVTIRRA